MIVTPLWEAEMLGDVDDRSTNKDYFVDIGPVNIGVTDNLLNGYSRRGIGKGTQRGQGLGIWPAVQGTRDNRGTDTTCALHSLSYRKFAGLRVVPVGPQPTLLYCQWLPSSVPISTALIFCQLIPFNSKCSIIIVQ